MLLARYRTERAGRSLDEASGLLERLLLPTTGEALVAYRNWTSPLGPGPLAGLNALLLGSLMYRSRLGVWLVVEGFKPDAAV